MSLSIGLVMEDLSTGDHFFLGWSEKLLKFAKENIFRTNTSS